MSTTLIPSTTHGTPSGNYDGSSPSFSSDSAKADGYYGYTDGLHTVAVATDGFVGVISIQGTLASEPTEDDWFTVTSYGDGSSVTTTNTVENFTGNFVYVRANVTNFTAGSITSIQFNY